jgi:hypothetical protein
MRTVAAQGGGNALHNARRKKVAGHHCGIDLRGAQHEIRREGAAIDDFMRPDRVVLRVEVVWRRSVKNMRGVTFKPNTDDMRDAPSLTIVPTLVGGGATVRVVPAAQRAHLARHTNICKLNIGTELRMAFGAALRDAIARDPARFDRAAILKDTEIPMVARSSLPERINHA